MALPLVLAKMMRPCGESTARWLKIASSEGAVLLTSWSVCRVTTVGVLGGMPSRARRALVASPATSTGLSSLEPSHATELSGSLPKGSVETNGCKGPSRESNKAAESVSCQINTCKRIQLSGTWTILKTCFLSHLCGLPCRCGMRSEPLTTKGFT